MAREDLSSVRPNHSCSSQLPRVSNSNRDSNHLNPSLLNSRRLLARHPILNAQTLSYPISHGTFIARLLLHSSNRNSPAAPLHLAPLPVVPVQHQHQVARGLLRLPGVMDGLQPRLRRAIPCCAMERRSSTQRITYVRNVRSLSHVLPTTHPHLSPPNAKRPEYRLQEP